MLHDELLLLILSQGLIHNIHLTLKVGRMKTLWNCVGMKQRWKFAVPLNRFQWLSGTLSVPAYLVPAWVCIISYDSAFSPMPLLKSPPLRIRCSCGNIYQQVLACKSKWTSLDGRQHQSRDGPRRARWPCIRRGQGYGSLLLRLKIRLLPPEHRLREPIHATVNERNYQ